MPSIHNYTDKMESVFDFTPSIFFMLSFFFVLLTIVMYNINKAGQHSHYKDTSLYLVKVFN